MGIYDTLNDMQQKAVFHTQGPLLLLAGAGSGKTRVLTHRIAYLIEEKGVNPWNIMAITFTNKAAGEMRERIDHLVGFGAESIWVSTFHSSCVRMLRRYIDRIGYDNNFTIYDTDDQKSIMKEVCKRLNIDTKFIKEKAILSMISKAKDELVSPEQYALDNAGDFGKSKIIKAYKEYQETLRKNNALDFDDLIVKTVELFKNCPDVLEYYQDRFQYIMIDEYQDTNTAQFMFVSMLAEKNKNLCVVGDDDQSIYKFRGANIKNILNFEKIFPKATTIKLEQNYRSTGNILEAANKVIENNKTRKKKILWTDREQGDKITFKQFDYAAQEAEMVAEEIKQLVGNKNHRYSDCACLYRTNAQSRLLEEKLLLANIPYRIVGGINFYQRKEIKDLLAYLKTVDNGKDDLAVRRVINIPRRGIGAVSIEKVAAHANLNEISFYEALSEAENIGGLGRVASKIKPFVDYIRVLRSKLTYITLKELMEDILETTGYISELQKEGTDEAAVRIENIEELISKIVSYEEENENPTLSGFLEEVALVASIDSLDENSDYVVLMTVHSAKGLEFPKVFLCGMEDGVFPSYMTMMSDDPDEIEEERRLCYVAITRAKDSLTISCAKARMIGGETQYNNLSRFLKEIPAALLDSSALKGKLTENTSSFRTSKTSKTKPMFHKKPYEVKQYTVTKSDGLEYGIGDTVKHIKFGTGIVSAIVDGGRDYEVTVEFGKVGIKKMFASFAKLQKIET